MKNRSTRLICVLLILCLMSSVLCGCSKEPDPEPSPAPTKEVVDPSEAPEETKAPVEPSEEPEDSPEPTAETEEPEATKTPETPKPTKTPETPKPTKTPETPKPTKTPETPKPAKTPEPTKTPEPPAEKKGDLYRARCDRKIWAGVLGKCYILFRNIDSANEWGESGKVYELYVTYVEVGESYSMWSDGYWELDSTGTKLTLTPVHQSENGNIGVGEGSSKTFTGSNGVFKIPVTFEQGGKTTVTLDLSNG